MAIPRPAKRRRLSPSVLDMRQADPYLLEEVNTLILDYVIYNATEAVFAEWKTQGADKAEAVGRTNVHLSLVDCIRRRSFLSCDMNRC